METERSISQTHWQKGKRESIRYAGFSPKIKFTISRWSIWWFSPAPVKASAPVLKRKELKRLLDKVKYQKDNSVDVEALAGLLQKYARKGSR